MGAFRKALVSFSCFLNFGWLNAASYCSSDVACIFVWLGWSWRFYYFLRFFIPVLYLLGMAMYSFGLLPSPLSVKTWGFSFIFESCHANIISNLHPCCFLILSHGGLAVPYSHSPRVWHQHIPAARSQGAPVTQTALQTQRRRAPPVTVKQTTLRDRQRLRWILK